MELKKKRIQISADRTKIKLRVFSYTAEVKKKETEKDGQYLDILLMPRVKGEKKIHTHFGLKPFYDSQTGQIGFRYVFFEDRGINYSRELELLDAQTGGILMRNAEVINPGIIPRVKIHYLMTYNAKKGIATLDKLELTELAPPQAQEKTKKI